MSTPFLGLRTVIYPVTDLKAATTWWSSLLDVAPYFEEPFYVGFNVAGYELGLVPDGDPGDGAHTYWGVDDVDGAISEAVALGAVVHSEPTDVGEGIITAMVKTPDGSLVGLIRNPHFVLP